MHLLERFKQIVQIAPAEKSDEDDEQMVAFIFYNYSTLYEIQRVHAPMLKFESCTIAHEIDFKLQDSEWESSHSEDVEAHNEAS